MQIFINEEAVESKIENEKNMEDVYSGIKNWAESKGKFLVAFKIDGNEKKDAELKNISINSVSRADFYIGESLDVVISSLSELDLYVDKIGDTLFGRDSLTPKEASDLEEGKKWILTVLESAESILRLDYKKMSPVGIEKTISGIIENLTSEKKLDTILSIEDYLENLRDLKLFIMDLINRLSLLNLDTETIKEILDTYANNMEVLKKEFMSVNENFQSGKEALANQLLQHSSGRLHIMISGLISVANKIHNTNIEELKFNDQTLLIVNKELSEKLNTIAKAFEDRDILTAGDTIEYELPEILDKFVPFLKALREKLV